MRGLAVLAGALVWDLLLGELPNRCHPVVAIGKLIERQFACAPQGRERQLLYGGVSLATGVAATVAPVLVYRRLLRRRLPLVDLLLDCFLLKATISPSGLLRAGEAVEAALRDGDLPLARQRLRSLVSRETSVLSAPLVAAAAVESVAENSSDALVAPLFWYAVAGVPGALAYRSINTYDSMVGYHGRYEHLGKAAARLDDLVNLLPARLCGCLIAAAAGRRWRRAWGVMLVQHGLTESPNAGWPMAAMAGALDVTLEKTGHYRLGDGTAEVTADHLRQANRLAAKAMSAAAALACAAMVVRREA